MKWCKAHNNGTGAFIELDQFGKHAAFPDGLEDKCKECYNRYRRELRNRNDNYLNYQREYRAKHHERVSKIYHNSYLKHKDRRKKERQEARKKTLQWQPLEPTIMERVGAK